MSCRHQAHNCANLVETGVYNVHPERVIFRLCDSSARFLNENTSARVFVNLVACSGGVPVGAF